VCYFFYFPVQHFSQKQDSIAFVPSAALLQKCPKLAKRVQFNDHAMLDQFALELLQQNPNFANEFHEDWVLLRKLDKLFWVRYFGNKFDRVQHFGCPFINEEDFAVWRK